MPSLSRAPSRQSGGGSNKTPASGGNTTNGKQGALGNADLAKKLLLRASEMMDGKVDMAKTLGVEEDPGKYQFPEGGDTETGSKSGGSTTPRQQTDKLPELRQKHVGKNYADTPGGTAFVKGSGDQNEVDPNDIAQGQLGDCYLMTGMAAMARANPDAIKKAIKDNGDGTYDVTLYIRKNSWSTPTKVTKTVDGRLPSSGYSALYAQPADKEGGATELWPALIEKTVAQHKGSYDLIEGGKIGQNGFNFAGVSELLTGKAEAYKATDKMEEDDILLELGAALEAHKPVSVDSRDLGTDEALTREANAVNVHWNHAYSVEKVDIDARTVDLQNPWGSHHVKGLPVAKLKQYYRGIRVGG